ncbi:SGNH/GDSL hydrolase family protein [Vagococcus hydrophili]|uniref:SGNH/GDSL hydrolase family protein n=1 Tax=Vagococcus hydrophili TaxID=2714947 RepID=A0A6G8APM0_9ENTE|nr:SGNH/GDSL hydrolase family protein [Vagococcus hydrophili]QIL47028.1 SGNH/GDSL hydrolase family protein [Vagococcus hydrophili]
MVYIAQHWNDYDENMTETQNIENGAVVTSERMNRIEGGVVENFNHLNQRKSDITYVDSLIGSVATGGPRDVFYSVKALNDRYPKGSDGTYLVFDSTLTEGAHTFIWKQNKWVDLGVYQGIELQDDSLLLSKINPEAADKLNSVDKNRKILKNLLFDYDESKNLFDLDKITLGKYVIDGKETDTVNSEGYCTDYIEVDKYSNYFFTNLFGSPSIAGARYDSNYRFIDNIKVSSNGDNIIESKRARFIRINIAGKPSDLVKNFGIYKGVAEQPFDVPNHGKIKGLRLDTDFLEGKLLPEQFADSKIFNLYNNDSSEESKYIDNLGRVGDAQIINLSRFIKVSPGERFLFNKSYQQPGGFFSYDKKRWMSKIELTKDDETWFYCTVPKNCYWMRINVVKIDLGMFMLTKGIKPKSFTPYKIENEWIKIPERMDGFLDDKNIAVSGDSITWLHNQTVEGVGKITGYQQKLIDAGANVMTYGNSGATYRLYDSAISNMEHGSLYKDIVIDEKIDFTKFDIFTMFGGTNDPARGANFGTVDSEDPKTTFGAVNLIIKYALEKNPKLKIYLFSPIQSTTDSRPRNKMIELCEGLKKIANFYSIPFKNMYFEGGINYLNDNTYLYDNLHPNNLGMSTIGELFVKMIFAK